MFKRSKQRLISQIAIVAVIFSSLAPTISHALASTNSTSQAGRQTLWQDVCSAQGAKVISSDFAAQNENAQTLASTVKSSKENSNPTNKMAMHFEHCPYCFSHAGSVVLPTSATALFLAEINAVGHIASYASPFVISYYSSSHPTRAPPVL